MIDHGTAKLYHYTTAGGALGILSSGALRATHAKYMNDAQKLQLAFQAAASVLHGEFGKTWPHLAPGIDALIDYCREQRLGQTSS